MYRKKTIQKNNWIAADTPIPKLGYYFLTFSENPFYLRRSRQIRERRALFFLLLLLRGGPFSNIPCTVFWGVKSKNFFLFFSKSLSVFTPLLKKIPMNSYLRCEKQKLFSVFLKKSFSFSHPCFVGIATRTVASAAGQWKDPFHVLISEVLRLVPFSAVETRTNLRSKKLKLLGTEIRESFFCNSRSDPGGLLNSFDWKTSSISDNRCRLPNPQRKKLIAQKIRQRLQNNILGTLIRNPRCRRLTSRVLAVLILS